VKTRCSQELLWRFWTSTTLLVTPKETKKRAVVAVARKLAVLLHRLWVTGEVYEPLRHNQKAVREVA
jgi:hypothetical protein